MMNKQSLLKVFSIIPISILYHILTFASSNSVDTPINELLAEMLFGSIHIGNSKSFVFIIDKMFYIIVFNLLFGTYVYKNFLISSVYVFTRLKNRKTWFYKKSLELICITALYTLLFLATLLFLCLYRTSYGFDAASMKMLVQLWILITLFLFFITILINLLAIRFGSNIAFLIVYICLIMLVSLSLQMRSLPVIIENPYLLLLNPVAAIILNMMDNTLMQLFSLLYFCLLNVLVIVTGSQYINRMDIALTDNESV